MCRRRQSVLEIQTVVDGDSRKMYSRHISFQVHAMRTLQRYTWKKTKHTESLKSLERLTLIAQVSDMLGSTVVGIQKFCGKCQRNSLPIANTSPSWPKSTRSTSCNPVSKEQKCPFNWKSSLSISFKTLQHKAFCQSSPDGNTKICHSLLQTFVLIRAWRCVQAQSKVYTLLWEIHWNNLCSYKYVCSVLRYRWVNTICLKRSTAM